MATNLQQYKINGANFRPNGNRNDFPVRSEEYNKLIDAIEDALVIAGGETLAATLALGNTTGGTSISMSNDDVIVAENGGGRLDLRYGADNSILLATDDDNYNEVGIEMYPTYLGIWANGYNAHLGAGPGQTPASESYMYMQTNQAQVGIFDSKTDYLLKSAFVNGLIMLNPDGGGGTASRPTDSLPAFLCTRNSTINSGASSAVAIALPK
jgi:hypothetical protein